MDKGDGPASGAREHLLSRLKIDREAPPPRNLVISERLAIAVLALGILLALFLVIRFWDYKAAQIDGCETPAALKARD